MIERIVSGGQTGCDRAAFDVALARSIPMSGWVPLGRTDEEGVIPARYPNLSEVGSADPAVRTEANVRDSDATLLISHGPLEGGSALTRVFCERQGRPWFHAALPAVGAREVCRWVERVRPAVLNVAGPRATEDPRVYEAARALLLEVLGGDARVSAKR